MPVSETMREIAGEDSPEEIVQWVILRAYQLPAWHTQELRDQEVVDFRNTIGTECLVVMMRKQGMSKHP